MTCDQVVQAWEAKLKARGRPLTPDDEVTHILELLAGQDFSHVTKRLLANRGFLCVYRHCGLSPTGVKVVMSFNDTDRNRATLAGKNVGVRG